MKILMINKYHQIIGGADTDFFATIRLLEQAGHQVIPFCLKIEGNLESPYSSYFVDGLSYRNWATAPLGAQLKTFAQGFYNEDARRSVERLVAEVQPDVAHVHNILYQLSPSVLEPLWRRRIPIVQTLHDYHLVCPGGLLYAQGRVFEQCANPLQMVACISRRCHSNSAAVTALAVSSHLFHKVTKIYAERVTAFTVPSRFMRAKMIERGVPAAKLTVIPHPLDASAFSPRYEPGEYALFVGRIVNIKGYDTLIRAAAGLNLRVIILGDGPADEKAHLQQLLESEHASNVEWLGPKSSAEVREYMLGSRFVVVPSESYENFPAVIREAFACGKPVIGSRIGGIPELVDDETGILFDPQNAEQLRAAMCELDADPERIVQLGKNARHRAETRLDPKVYLNSLVHLYQSLLEHDYHSLPVASGAANST